MSTCHSVDHSTCLHKVELILNSLKHQTLRLGPEDGITLDGQTIAIPYSSQGLKIFGSTKNSLVIETHVGINLVWEPSRSISVTRKSGNLVAGLCGNGNGKASDDLRLRDGVITVDYEGFHVMNFYILIYIYKCSIKL